MQNKQYTPHKSTKNTIINIYTKFTKQSKYIFSHISDLAVKHNFEQKFNTVGGYLYNVNIFKSAKTIITSVFLFFFGYMVINANDFGDITIKKMAENQTIDLKQQDDNIVSLDNVIIADTDRPGRFTYIVQRGDTIDSIAQDFWVTAKSIDTTNKLNWTKIKQWQELVIAEVDGMVYTMPDTMSLIAFAWKYGINIDDLKELNYISDENQQIQKWDEIFLPIVREEAVSLGLIKETKDDKDFVEFIKQNDKLQQQKQTIAKNTATKTTTTTTTKTNTTTKKPTTTKPTVTQTVTSSKKVWSVWRMSTKWRNSFGFALGNCTWYAAQMRPDIFVPGKTRPFWGNGKQRYANAKRAWFSVWTTPKVWAIVVFNKWRWWYGHVGIVRWYDKDGITMESMNYRGRFIISVDEVSYSGIIWYIY